MTIRRAANAAALCTLLAACKPAPERPTDDPEQAIDERAPAPAEETLPKPPEIADAPSGLPPTPSPGYNPTTPAKVALGRALFFDPRLSVDRSMSCASCHKPEQGFADGRALSTTVRGALNRRHTPTLFNVGYHREFYWDGRSDALEKQILANWRGQMAAVPEEVCAQLAAIPMYHAMFDRAFREAPSPSRVADALASFVRTLRSGGSPWDRYEAGETAEVPADVVAGARVFAERAGCALCHPPPLYTDLSYHRIGVTEPELSPDPGRSQVTGRAADDGAFKTPGLRGLLYTAPYFHNGTAATLDDVLALKLRSAPRRLTATEARQLRAFLLALSRATPPKLEAPALPPDAIADGDAGTAGPIDATPASGDG